MTDRQLTQFEHILLGMICLQPSSGYDLKRRFALTPLGMTLGQGLMLMDGNWLAWIQKQSPSWSWAWLELPFLLRPLWLIPAGMGLICAGAAASLNFGRASPSRRKRS